MSVHPDFHLQASAESPDPSTGSLHFIGTATVLLRLAGFTILTDPNFIHRHEKVDLGGGIQAVRQTDPAIDIHQLPPVDLVVLSHFHGDHFDRVAIAELAKHLPIVTTPHAAKELQQHGFTNTIALETWGDVSFFKNGTRLRITATPGRHGPAVVSFALPDVMGSILDFQSAEGAPFQRLYITGDTLVYDDIKEIPRRYPGVDLALLHLGGTVVLGILVTMDAKQGVEMIQIIRPKLSIPIHYNDYNVFKSSLEDFQKAVDEAGLTGQVRYLRHGETYEF